MGVPGLTIYHVKSHLQVGRLLLMLSILRCLPHFIFCQTVSSMLHVILFSPLLWNHISVNTLFFLCRNIALPSIFRSPLVMVKLALHLCDHKYVLHLFVALIK